MYKRQIADGEQTYAADPLTCDWDSLIEELGAPSVSSTTIYDVTHEAAFDYYGNEIDLEMCIRDRICPDSGQKKKPSPPRPHRAIFAALPKDSANYAPPEMKLCGA